MWGEDWAERKGEEKVFDRLQEKKPDNVQSRGNKR